MKCQKCSKGEVLREVGEVLCYVKDRTARLKTDWQSIIKFAQINVY